MRTVIIGFGKSARIDAKMAQYFPRGAHHLCMDAPLNLVGIADHSSEARAEARRLYPKIQIVPDAANLADLEPEIAILAIPPGTAPHSTALHSTAHHNTPRHTTRAEVVAALPSVKGLMVEKPLGNPAERAPLVEIVEERKLVAQVAYWRRADPAMRNLPEIGPVQAGFGLYGSGLRNNGSHLVDLIRMLCGEITGVRGSPRAFTLEVPGAQVSVHEIDFWYYREVALDLWAKCGRIVINNEGLVIREFKRTDNRGIKDVDEIDCETAYPITARADEALPALYSNLYAAITRGEELLSPLSSAVRTEEVLDAIENPRHNT